MRKKEEIRAYGSETYESLDKLFNDDLSNTELTWPELSECEICRLNHDSHPHRNCNYC